MADREEILKEKTFKGDVDDLGQRVYYTLFYQNDKAMQVELSDSRKIARTQKFLSALVAKLHADAVLDDSDIDDLLFDTVQS